MEGIVDIGPAPPARPADASVELTLLAALRGHRRKLGDMAATHGELKLRGFRWDPWMERWRLACHVLSIPHGVSYVQLGPPGHVPVAPTVQLSTPTDEAVLTDKPAIFARLASAATAAAAWMARLSDADLQWHIDRADSLGAAVLALLSAGTTTHMSQALAAVRAQLGPLEDNKDLARFVRRYRKPTDGTHFLDALYAPLLLRVHLCNRYAEPQTPLVDMAAEFPVMHMWLQKCAQWPLFTRTVLGPDWATEMAVYYRDRGAVAFNSDVPLELHAKFEPAAWLRRTRLAACASALTALVDVRPVDARWRQRCHAVCDLCQAVLQVEAEHLQRAANVALRLTDFDKAHRACAILLPALSSEAAVLAALEGVRTAFAQVVQTALDDARLAQHLLANLTLQQLWALEIRVLTSLSARGGCVDELARAWVAHQSGRDRERLTACLVEMVLLSCHEAEAASQAEKALKDVLQCLYRECSPTAWAELACAAPLVHGVVISKDNWHMHHKFPAVALLSASYNIIKSQVMHLHPHLGGPASGDGPARDPLALLPVSHVREQLHTVMRWAAIQDRAMVHVYLPLLNGLGERTGHHYVSRVDQAAWAEEQLSIASQASALEALLLERWDDERVRKRARLQWRKLKKDLVLLLRSQKKLVLPTMLRFVDGEALVEAQKSFVNSLSSEDLPLVLQAMHTHDVAEEARGFFSALRFYQPERYRTTLQLLNPNASDPTSVWHLLQPLSVAADQDWLAEPAHWALHPKYAGLPFFMGLSTRVLLEDMQTCVKALQRSLRGLGSLPTADARATFEILYAHSVSHHTLIFTPIVAALAGGDTGDRCDFGPELRALDDALVAAEVAQGEGPARRVELERALGASQALLASASQQLAAFSAKYVPRCITGFTSDDAIALFASVVQLYHTGNPHLLSRTVEALRVEEYETFCLGMLSLPFALLKEVLDGLRAEIPTRLWLHLVERMPCLSGVSIDSPHWLLHPHYGGVALFWQLSHRWLEDQLATLLATIGDKVLPSAVFGSVLSQAQLLMVHLERHGQFEDTYLLPRVAAAVPTVAESSYEDTNNEHSLLETNEGRVIVILKQSVKCLKAEPDLTPSRQLNRLKRQLRSYQTLLLPHLCKEEEKYLPVMLHRFTPAQWLVLRMHLFEIYGDLLCDDFLLGLLGLATPLQQTLLLTHFVPFYVDQRTRTGHLRHAPTDSLHHDTWTRANALHFETAAAAATYCRARAPDLWQRCLQTGLFASVGDVK